MRNKQKKQVEDQESFDKVVFIYSHPGVGGASPFWL